MMFAFTDAERASLKQLGAIVPDSRGREVLAGLTLEETKFYMQYVRLRILNRDNPEDGEKYLGLHEKHERARLGVVGAENELRTTRPTRQ